MMKLRTFLSTQIICVSYYLFTSIHYSFCVFNYMLPTFITHSAHYFLCCVRAHSLSHFWSYNELEPTPPTENMHCKISSLALRRSAMKNRN